MTISRMEVNISRLLLQCEKMVASDEYDSNWRYEQYVKALQSQYEALKTSPSAPGTEKMNEFRRRIEHLHSFLPPPAPSVSRLTSDPGSRPSAAVSPLASPVIAVSGGPDRDVLAELRHRRGGRQQAEARAQLLGTSTSTSAEPPAAEAAEDDFELVMKRHQKMQEKAAEEMLALTRNLKEQSLIAKNVITKDKETLERSTAQTDTNAARLGVEQQRLTEFSARSCRCWLWMMLAVVCVTFMGMVVFIRLFGKKYRAMAAAAVEPVPGSVPGSVADSVAGSGAGIPYEGSAEVGLLCGWLGWLLPLCDGG